LEKLNLVDPFVIFGGKPANRLCGLSAFGGDHFVVDLGRIKNFVKGVRRLSARPES